MENWFKDLIKFDKFENLAKNNVNDKPNIIRLFPKKERFHFYEGLADTSGETCFIPKSMFKDFLSERYKDLEIIPCSDFSLEVEDTKQLRSLNSYDDWSKISINEDYGSYQYLYQYYGLNSAYYDIMILGENINPNKKDYNVNEYSYVIFYIDEVLDMAVVFKSTYHEYGKKDLSFGKFKEDGDSVSEPETLDEAVKYEKVDKDYLFTKMSNSHLFFELLDHAVFRHDVRHVASLNSKYLDLADSIRPKNKYTKSVREKIFGM